MIPDLPPMLIEEAVRAALAEDLGRAGDVTTQATIPRERAGPGGNCRARFGRGRRTSGGARRLRADGP